MIKDMLDKIPNRVPITGHLKALKKYRLGDIDGACESICWANAIICLMGGIFGG
jgi:hypothetical protein